MTEDEAKTKWCPFARVFEQNSSAPAHNKTQEGKVGGWTAVPGAAYCIASTCMAWRWSETKRTAAFLEAVQAHMQASDKPNFNTSVQKVYAETGGQFERVEGYCGLAGSVQ